VRDFATVACLIFALGLAACARSKESSSDEANSNNKAPLAVVRALLKQHGLLGRTPEERTLRERETPVERSLIEPLFADLGREELFLEEIYIGFIVGVLARHQDNLMVDVTGSRASVQAGAATVVLVKKDEQYRIVLQESVPEGVRKRALQEQERYKTRSLKNH